MFNKVVLFGVGLIGGSFSLALKQAGVVRHVAGVDIHPASLERAQALGIIDSLHRHPETALIDTDLIIIATPVGQIDSIFSTIAPHLSPHTLITDVGSTKQNIITCARTILKEKIGQFIPAHPIAGREHHGPDAATATLYQGHNVILCPLPENDPANVARIAQAWEQCEAQVHFFTPEQHDAIFATISHLPHLLAYALVHHVTEHEQADLLFQHAAGGFRDFTRIASSSPEMWRDITLANRDALLTELDGYLHQLEQLRTHLIQADAPAIETLYRRAQEARQRWLGQKTP